MVKAMDKMRYPRKKGYAGRYVRHELGKNKLNLLLGCVFLLGALVGCQLAGQDPETILSQLGSLFSATGQSAGFLDTVVASFAANAAPAADSLLVWAGGSFSAVGAGGAVLEGLGPRRVGCLFLQRWGTCGGALLSSGAAAAGAARGAAAGERRPGRACTFRFAFSPNCCRKG